jgi:hypothetical protein
MVAPILGVVVYCLWVGAVLHTPVDDVPYGTLLAIPLLTVLVLVAIGPMARAESRFDLRAIMLSGFFLRLGGAYLRWLSPVDALVYHQEGVRIAGDLRSFDLWPDLGRQTLGTGWLRYTSGWVHVLTFDDMSASFLVFTTMSFFGVVLCYRAFVHAVPDGHHRRYALLLFLWPSLLYWPSSIGKEAWMILGIGIACWGVSRVLTGRVGLGLAVLVLGLTEMSLVRPHVALMVIAGLGVALLARPNRQRTAGARTAGLRTTGRIVVVLVLLVGGSIVAGKTAERLNLDDTGADAISTALANTAAQTDQGGGAFKPATVNTPIEYPYAFVTVWFRPFPTEARGTGGASQFASALENLVLILLILLCWREVRQLPRALVRVPYATYAVTYVVAFVYAFAAIANFGILARQRTQGLVLLFVILCLPDLVATRPPSQLRRRLTAATSRATSLDQPARRRPALGDRPARGDAPAEPAPSGSGAP